MNDKELEMYRFAENLVIKAGRRLKRECVRADIKMREKTCHSDIVTEQDVMIENYLTNAITAKYEEHQILAEEHHSAASPDACGYTWIIDPIDGTFNFYRFSVNYAISLALYRGGVPVFGFVYDVAGGVLHKGNIGDLKTGSIYKGEKCVKENLKEAVLVMSFTTMKDLQAMGTDVFKLLSGAGAHRYLGSASLELSKLAAGDYDAYLSTNLCHWDIAAARVLVEQSGGHMVVRRNHLKEGKLYVAAFRSEKVWEQIKTLLSEGAAEVFAGA